MAAGEAVAPAVEGVAECLSGRCVSTPATVSLKRVYEYCAPRLGEGVRTIKEGHSMATAPMLPWLRPGSSRAACG